MYLQFASSHPLWMLIVAVYVPTAVALAYGVVLCLHHAYRKPQTTKFALTAILLLVASAAPEVSMPFAAWMGYRLPGYDSMPLAVVIMQSGLQAAGLALLFWTAFLDERPLEFDPGPPVYRNDDGPAADV